jgi:hypothetical protein
MDSGRRREVRVALRQKAVAFCYGAGPDERFSWFSHLGRYEPQGRNSNGMRGELMASQPLIGFLFERFLGLFRFFAFQRCDWVTILCCAT